MSLVYFSMHVVVTGGFPQEKEVVAMDLTYKCTIYKCHFEQDKPRCI
jgi:hypothetical protein